MKETRILYGIAVLAVIGILVSFIGYATDTPGVHISKQHSPVKTEAPTEVTTSTKPVPPVKATTSTTITDKPCSCCAKRAEHARKRIQQAQERGLATESGTKTGIHNE
jgi:hypothetical protein